MISNYSYKSIYIYNLKIKKGKKRINIIIRNLKYKFMYLYFEGYGGIEPHIHDLQSKRRSICNISLFFLYILIFFMYYLLRNTIIIIIYIKKLVKKIIHDIKYYFYSVLIR